MIDAKVTDEELVYLSQEQNEEAQLILFQRYDKLIRILIRKNNYDLRCFDELYSIAQVTLNEIISKYDNSFQIPFYRYYVFCVKRKFIDFWRSQHFQNTHINSIVTDFDLYESQQQDYQMELIDKLVLHEEVENVYGTFSKVERDVATRYFDEVKPREIANELKLSEKKVYNTIYALKKKVRNTQK